MKLGIGLRPGHTTQVSSAGQADESWLTNHMCHADAIGEAEWGGRHDNTQQLSFFCSTPMVVEYRQGCWFRWCNANAIPLAVLWARYSIWPHLN